MKKLNKAIDFMLNIFIGFMLAVFLAGFALVRQPVIAHIISMENKGVETRFIVDCKAIDTSRVVCRKADEAMGKT